MRLQTLFYLTATLSLMAQPSAITPAERADVIERTAAKLAAEYSTPELGEQMAKKLRDQSTAGAYDSIVDGAEFARKLTADLHAVYADGHLRVIFDPAPRPGSAGGQPGSPDEFRARLARENYGVAKVEILPGNVGYLDLRYFADPEWAGDTYAAAFQFLANTDALIIDLRRNGGSMSMDAIPMVSGYLLGEPKHLITLFWRPDNSTRQTWSFAYVPGRRYLDKPVYLLTSRHTFSGGEEFAYNLKNLKRAVLVGETTGGGANPGGTQKTGERFSIWLPVGKVTSPLTNTNWEGIGVQPDVPAAAPRALHQAHQIALRTLIEKAPASLVPALQRTLAEVEKNAPNLRRVTFRLADATAPSAASVSVAGSFNGWSTRANPLRREGQHWVAEIEIEPGQHSYKFVVDGAWILDPENPEKVQDGPNENSLLTVR